MEKKFEELLNAAKLNEILRGKQSEKKENPYTVILVIVGAIALIAAIAYAVYYFFVPDRMVDFGDEFDDEFSDDMFENAEEFADEVVENAEEVVENVKEEI